MKSATETTACVVDYGTFIGLAERLSESYSKVYYYSPFEQEYEGIKTCVIGDGIKRLERMDEFLEPSVLNTIDLFVFPDIGYGGLQRHLRSIGKLVWGSMGASEFELYRTRFLKLIGTLGLRVLPYKTVKGVTSLCEYLKSVERKWVKVNRLREDMETWFHLDWDHSQRELERLAIKFGGLKEHVVFVVQDEIEDASEIGYDGYTVNGKYPSVCFSGYEKKNELYLGSLLKYDQVPEPVQAVNSALSKVFEEYGYCNHFASEIRAVNNDEFYFIDPTMRMAGQTMEHQFRSCTNLPEIILHGAAGELVDPEYESRFAAEATLHYTSGCAEDWKVLRVPDEARFCTSFYHFCEGDGLFHFPPGRNDEVGVVFGFGDTIEGALDSLKENMGLFGDQPVSIRFEDFSKLLEEIRLAEENGMEFTSQTVPEPETALDKE